MMLMVGFMFFGGVSERGVLEGIRVLVLFFFFGYRVCWKYFLSFKVDNMEENVLKILDIIFIFLLLYCLGFF